MKRLGSPKKNLGVSNKNQGVSNENLGVSNADDFSPNSILIVLFSEEDVLLVPVYVCCGGEAGCPPLPAGPRGQG